MKVTKKESENQNSDIEIDKENIEDILNSMTKNVQIEKIAQNEFKLIFEDSL